MRGQRPEIRGEQAPKRNVRVQVAFPNCDSHPGGFAVLVRTFRPFLFGQAFALESSQGRKMYLMIGLQHSIRSTFIMAWK